MMAFPRSGMQISTPSDGKIGQCIREANIPILLREDKLEFELGGPDAYMQLARCYDWLWESSLTRSRLIPMPITISPTEHHVS